MGAEVRAVVRQGTSPQTSSANLAMAPRRDGCPDRRPTILALAGGRRRGRGSRFAGATAARQERGCETHAKTAQETRFRTRRVGDGQATLLRRGKGDAGT